MTKILRKSCSSLVKIISDGENNFTQNKYNKLPKISAKNKCFFCKKLCKSANIESSTVQLHGVDLIDMKFKNDYKNWFLYYIKRMWLYSFSGYIIIFVYKV